MRWIPIGLAACLIALPALAQDRGAGARIRLPNLGGPPQGSSEASAAPSGAASVTAIDKAFNDFHAQVAKIEKAAVDDAITDLTAAIQDATNRKDAISLPCWTAQVAFLKMLPVEWENPPQKIGLALGFQIQRDLLNAVTGNDPGSLKVACAALLGDQLRIITNVAALVGLKVATAGIAP